MSPSPATKYIAVNDTAQKPQMNSIDGSLTARTVVLTDSRADSRTKMTTQSKLRSVLSHVTGDGSKGSKSVVTTYIKL